jgi:hypothetical protein
MKMETSASVAPISLVASEKSARGAMALSVEYCVVCGDRASGNATGSIRFFPPVASFIFHPQVVTTVPSAARDAKDSSSDPSASNWATRAAGAKTAK